MHLQKPTPVGGLGLPVFKCYYCADNARALNCWQWGVTGEPLLKHLHYGYELKLYQYQTLFFLFCFFSETKPSTEIIVNNFVVRSSLRFLNQILNHFFFTISLHSCSNLSLFCSISDRKVFFTWRENRLQYI